MPGVVEMSLGSSADAGASEALLRQGGGSDGGGFVGGDSASEPVTDDATAVLAQSSVQAPTPDIDIPQSLDEG